MRIALVSQEYPPATAKGGIGTQTALKARGMQRLGHDVHVISRSADGKVSHAVEDGIHVTRVPGFGARMALHTEPADWLTYSAEVAAALATVHARSPLDLIDFPEWGAEGYVHLLNRTQWNHIPTVLHLHGPLVMFAHTMGWPDLNSEFYRTGTIMEGTCVRLADAVFSSSRCSADWCATHYGIKRETVPVLHTGVDTEIFAPRRVAKAERPTIVFAGKLVRNKGVHLLVEAACELAGEFPSLHLWLLGRGAPEMVAELQNLADAAGRPGLLHFAGFVHQAELPDHLSRAHLFAAPSEYEGGPGFVYLEAMACGLPVIACAGSGASEVITPEGTGLLIPAQDRRALVSALRRLLTDHGLRTGMGQRARAYVVRHADSRLCLREIEAFYLRVIAGDHGKTGADA